MATSVLAGYSDIFAITDMPFLFDNFAHSDRFTKTEEFVEMNKTLENSGLYLWYWSILGYKQPNLVKSVITNPQDCVGLKWRTMENPVQIGTVRALGAIPITIAYSEVYNALQMGVADAWMNDAIAFKNLSTYEVAPYSTELPLFASCQTMIVSKRAFDALLPENQAIVRRIIDQEMPGVIGAARKQNDILVEELKTKFKGYYVVKDPAPYLKLVQSVYTDFLAKYPQCKKYIDAINRVR